MYDFGCKDSIIMLKNKEKCIFFAFSVKKLGKCLEVTIIFCNFAPSK